MTCSSVALNYTRTIVFLLWCHDRLAGIVIMWYQSDQRVHSDQAIPDKKDVNPKISSSMKSFQTFGKMMHVMYCAIAYIRNLCHTELKRAAVKYMTLVIAQNMSRDHPSFKRFLTIDVIGCQWNTLINRSWRQTVFPIIHVIHTTYSVTV